MASFRWIFLTFLIFGQNSAKKLHIDSPTPAEDRDFFEMKQFYEYAKREKMLAKGKPSPFGVYGESPICPFFIGTYPGIEGKVCIGPYGPMGPLPQLPPRPKPRPPPSKTSAAPPTPPQPSKIPHVVDDEDDVEEEEEYEYIPKKRCRCIGCRRGKCRYEK